jgi:energy-coupling factor transporter ATP-binding protein EcfA2
MKILKFQAENVMKLSAVEIVPKDNMIEITGKNGAGKSSILDSIVMALTGGKAIPEKPIKKGADKGKIVIEIPGYQITRSFTKDNTYLKIEGVDGANIKQPQKFLDDLVGSISFDPLDFINRDQKEQRRVLLELIGVNVDALDAEKKEVYDDRTAIGRDLKSAEASLKDMVYDPDVKQTKEVSISDLVQKLQEAVDHNAQWEFDRQKVEELKNKAMSNKAEITKLEDEISILKLENIELRKQYDEKLAELDGTAKIDINGFQLQISEVDEKNKSIRDNLRYLAAKKVKDDCQEAYNTRTTQLNEIETRRNELLSTAKMPVPGLSFNESELLYNDIPLSQASDGEKLVIGLGISMALNPKLRVLRIKDGSLLDESNRQIIREQLKDKDYQLWFESVSSDKSVGIFIEDGGVVAIDGEVPKVAAAKVTKKKVVESKVEIEAKSTNPNDGWD